MLIHMLLYKYEVNIMANVYHGRGYVYSIQYHIVWCVKYRRRVLDDTIENKLIEILNKIAKDNNFKIVEINSDLDHIHLLIECTPQHYIPDMIKALKGVSARLLVGGCGVVLGGGVWGSAKAEGGVCLFG